MTTIAPDEAPQHLETRGLQQAADLASRRERCLTIRTRLAEHQAGPSALPALHGRRRSP